LIYEGLGDRSRIRDRRVQYSADIVAQAPPTTQAPAPVTLSKTGSDSTSGMVQGGLWLLLFGVVGMVLARRRRHDDVQPSSV